MSRANRFNAIGGSRPFQARATVAWIPLEGFTKILFGCGTLSQKLLRSARDAEILRAGLGFVPQLGQPGKFLLRLLRVSQSL